MEIELIVLIVIQLVGSSSFARFEIETPAYRKIMKWFTMDACTIALYFLIGHYALVLPALILVSGTTFHLIYCRKHGIDPIHATPRKKYYELRGWKWQE